MKMNSNFFDLTRLNQILYKEKFFIKSLKMKARAAPFEKNIKTVELPAVRSRYFRILRSPQDSKNPGSLGHRNFAPGLRSRNFCPKGAKGKHSSSPKLLGLVRNPNTKYKNCFKYSGTQHRLQKN